MTVGLAISVIKSFLSRPAFLLVCGPVCLALCLACLHSLLCWQVSPNSVPLHTSAHTSLDDTCSPTHISRYIAGWHMFPYTHQHIHRRMTPPWSTPQHSAPALKLLSSLQSHLQPHPTFASKNPPTRGDPMPSTNLQVFTDTSSISFQCCQPLGSLPTTIWSQSAIS